jgi:hypothetical protein
MKKVLRILLAGTATFSLGGAATLDAWRPLQVRYTIFSGYTLGDRDAPTPTDRKLAILVDGQAAKEIFDSIGPDLPSSCSQEKGDHDREKQGVQCTYAARRRAKGYQCWIGIDLRTGKSTATASC